MAETRNVSNSNNAKGYSNNGYKDTSFSSIAKRSTEKDKKDKTGCVELGRDGGRGNFYQTRYRIDHSEQRSDLWHDVLLEEMSPCCGEKAHRSCGYMSWAILRSEAFLFTLHMTALALGVIKEAGNFREENENLHLIHSIVETVVSVLLISVRVASAWTSFYHIKKTAKRYEKLPEKDENYKKHHVQGQSLKRHLIALTCVGIFLVLFLIATFLMFKYLAHLGWTILTNQFALVVITLVSGLFMARVNLAEAVIKEDHQRTVLYEAVLLLRELHQISTEDKVSQAEKEHVFFQVDTFCKALRDTKLFEQPEHIKFDEDYRPVRSQSFNAMLQSCV